MNGTVVVIGGGYGGAAVAKALDSEMDVIVIDPRDAFVNSAGSLRALAQPDWAPNMFYPFDTMLTRGKAIRDRAVSVDRTGVTLSSGQRVDADYIVLATGSNYAFPAKPDADLTSDSLETLQRTHKELAGADHVLILGAGPVGLELAGETKEVWPEKRVTVIDPATELLPGFLPSVREDLEQQLAELGIEVRLGTLLSEPPPVPSGKLGSFTVSTTTGEEITANIWFQAFGVALNSDFLADGKLISLTPQGEVPVTPTLNVQGYDNVFALGDITALGEKKMAGYAMQHADVVTKNILSLAKGETPEATYTAATGAMILLPLGPAGGVGQLPGEDGPFHAPRSMVSEFKGADLFTGRFTAQFCAPAGS
jgi:apoptosis-inducing factor 2